MTTVVLNPRPELRKEDASPTHAVLASSFLEAWQTVGHSYEALTVGIAPGNGGRTVPAPHDHGVAGPGVFLAHAPMRWQGRGGVGSGLNGGAKVHPFGLAATFAWAGLVVAYTAHVMTLVIYGQGGNGDGTVPPNTIPGVLSIQLNGRPLAFGFEPVNQVDGFMITAGLGLVPAGVHTLALSVSLFELDGETWTITGAEVWSNDNEQFRLPP